MLNGTKNGGDLGLWIWCVFTLYLLVVLWISWISRKRTLSSNQYLNASLSLPTWAVALSFLAYNCGSIEILGMSAMAAQYGVQAFHFYWIGGIPGMVFMAVVVLPLYMRAGARSLPEFLEMRFGPDVRLASACLSTIATAGFSGVTLYALAKILHVMVGWGLLTATLVAAGAVVAYVVFGGIRATIYTSVFQLCVLIAGLAPLLFMTVHFSPASFAVRSAKWHLWQTLPLLSPEATLDRFGVVFGLGFVISFSYWCTDFVMIQRALAAKTVEAARTVPLFAGFGKMAIAFLVVLPAVGAPSLLRGVSVSFDEVLPTLLSATYGPLLLAIGAAALMAGLMAGLAGNVSGFAAAFTEEIYRARIRPKKSELHYLRVGRISVLCCILLAFLGEYATIRFQDLMELLQLILALTYAPVFAVVLLGAVSRRINSVGAIFGMAAGLLSGVILQATYWNAYLHFGSQMSANFYTALLDFLVTAGVCNLASNLGNRRQRSTSGLLVTSNLSSILRPSATVLALSLALLAMCAFLNWVWR